MYAFRCYRYVSAEFSVNILNSQINLTCIQPIMLFSLFWLKETATEYCIFTSLYSLSNFIITEKM